MNDKLEVAFTNGRLISTPVDKPDGIPCDRNMDGTALTLSFTHAVSPFTDPAAYDRGPSELAKPFLGRWYIHPGQIEITSPHRGTITFRGYCNPDCAFAEYVSLVVSADGKRLYGRIDRVGSVDDKGRPDPHRTPGPDVRSAVGERFWLEVITPHVLKEGVIFARPPPSDGETWIWCRGEGVEKGYTEYCG